jgi:DNA-binding GntR family transcriptional regulator
MDGAGGAGGVGVHSGPETPEGGRAARRRPGGPAGDDAPSTYADYATRTLREAILNGDLAPGTPLRLHALARQLGVSVAPVRETLQRLRSEGLVDQVPQRSAFVSAVSIEDLEDTYSVRVTIEALAVRRAAARMSARQYEALARCLDEYEAAYRRRDEVAGRAAHRRFHFGLYEVAQSGWLMRFIAPLWENSERYRRLTLRRRGSLASRRREHKQILEACRRGQGEKAAELMAQHLLKTVELVRREFAFRADAAACAGADSVASAARRRGRRAAGADPDDPGEVS